MPVDIDFDNLPPFPERIPEKLKAIREHFKLSPHQFARTYTRKTVRRSSATKTTRASYR